MTITREQALCLLFCEEINEDNISRPTKQTELMKDIEICCEKDPLQPIILPIIRINANQSTYHRHSSNAFNLEKIINKENVKLTSDGQTVRSLNDVYVPLNLYNDDVYEHRDVTMKDILSFLWKHTEKFDDKTIESFTFYASRFVKKITKKQ